MVIETVAISLTLDSVKGKLPTVPDSASGGSSRESHTTIEYFFDVKNYDSLVEYRLRLAMNKIEQASCVRFKSVLVDSERTDYSKTLLRITNPENQRECSHEPSIDKNDNVVRLVLGIDCLQERDILHSLLHAIGFNDEITNPQRDHYVRVLWNNIHPKYHKLFRIKVNEYFALHPIEYDPLSIMQFNEWAFGSNGRPTIIPVGYTERHKETDIMKTPDTWYPSNELSTIDKLKLRILFGSACTRRKLTDLMDSCKVLMASDKQKEENGNDGGNDNNGGEELDGGSGNKDLDISQQHLWSEDKQTAKDKPKNNETSQDRQFDDNVSSSGPQIIS